jgi:hypothetical protein
MVMDRFTASFEWENFKMHSTCFELCLAALELETTNHAQFTIRNLRSQQQIQTSISFCTLS